MSKKKFWKLILISLVYSLICIFSGFLGWDKQTVIVSLLSFFCISYSYLFIVPKLYTSLLVISPFFLFYIISGIIVVADSLSYPVWICGLLVSIITILFITFKVRLIISIPIIFAILIVEYFLIYPNYFSYITTKGNPDKFSSAFDLKIVDENNNDINKEQLKGKVVLFDVWHSACLACIEGFPELQSLYDNYRSDSLVKIVALNVPIERDNGIKPTKITSHYTFEKLYLFDIQEHKKLPFEWVPLVLIFDKKMHCRYAGELNIGWNTYIGNTNKIIDKLKMEK